MISKYWILGYPQLLFHHENMYYRSINGVRFYKIIKIKHLYLNEQKVAIASKTDNPKNITAFNLTYLTLNIALNHKSFCQP